MKPISKTGLSVLLLLISMQARLSFAQNAEVFGRVVDGPSMLPIPFAQIQIDNISVKADSAGNFSMKNLPEKDVEVTFSHADYETLVEKFPLNTKRILDIQARLRPLKYFEPRPESDATLSAYKSDANLSAYTADPYKNSSMTNADIVFEGKLLKEYTLASYNLGALLSRLANLVPGASYNGGFYFLSAAARFKPQAALVLMNNTFVTYDYSDLPMLPRDIVRVEVCKPTGSAFAIAGPRGAGGVINIITRK